MTVSQTHPVPAKLTRHLESWLGRWPAHQPGLEIVASGKRTLPEWDGVIHPAFGIGDPERAVLSVPPAHAETVRTRYTALGDRDRLGEEVPAIVGYSDRGWFRAYYRWTTNPEPLPDLGVWISTLDPKVPTWLKPFNGDVLVKFDDQTGEYLAGVGIKRHDEYGHEIAVGTAEPAQGKGFARRLVAQAARRILDEGAIPTYMYETDNHASAKVATAAGFPDVGWSAFGVSEEPVIRL